MGKRVVVAKPGLDGHDRGAKVVAYALREAGFEVIYTGIRQTPRAIAMVATDEDADVVGLSILSGSHIPLARQVVELLNDTAETPIPVVVGGAIPPADVPRLHEAGVAAVFPTGAQLSDLVTAIDELCAGRVRT
jgi:methylmalonyl-CoA mutase, C-terminal domain